MTIEVDVLKTALTVLFFWNAALTLALVILNSNRKLDIDILRTRTKISNIFSGGRDY